MVSAKINPIFQGVLMTRNQTDSRVGDRKSPSLRASGEGLRQAADQADQLPAEKCMPARNINVLESIACAVNMGESREARPTCKQYLWFSFFFDGTGNNLEADKPMRKYSNVAKLFLVHKTISEERGIYRLYIPGVGTYFPEVGDNGGSMLGLGTGAMGEERLDYALKKFDDFLKPHLAREKSSPSSQIVEINISVFGFSRGAALARAFVNLMLEERCVRRNDKLRLKGNSAALRFRFMGIFDTVASVGVPMSNNTTSKAGAVFSSVRYMISDRLRNYRDTRPQVLAFSESARPGADPAPGKYDGHLDWGGRLAINPIVEEVRHFVAGHENRNSFPVDSISTLGPDGITKPAHFYEFVYPGVHSDVGGSYALGEGGRSEIRTENLGLVPLIHMYKFAIACGVPLLPPTAWPRQNKDDFEVSPSLLKSYNTYLKRIAPSPVLGELINQHMALYFAWRFRSIRMKAAGSSTESQRISQQQSTFKEGELALDKEIENLRKKETLAIGELNNLIARRAAVTSHAYGMPSQKVASDVSSEQISTARQRRQAARDELLRAEARKFAHPNMDELQQMINLYDQQLLDDVRSVREKFLKLPDFGSRKENRSNLRPHYRVLVEAFENEYETKRGLTDQEIISFFDNYVHDSLSAFAKDATLPSDPRVVYLGGDEKYQYARHSGEEFHSVEEMLASDTRRA